MPVSSLGLSAFLTSQGPEEKEESQPNSGNSPCEESLVSCIVSSVAPELSHRGTEEAGAGGLVSRRPEVKRLLMCRCGKDSGRSPRHTEEPGRSLRVGAATREPPAWDFAPATVERTEKSNLKDAEWILKSLFYRNTCTGAGGSNWIFVSTLFERANNETRSVHLLIYGIQRLVYNQMTRHINDRKV